MRVGIVGCGLIGQRRAAILRSTGQGELVVVADVDGAKARDVASRMGCESTTEWRDVVVRSDLDAIVVSTTNDWLSTIATAALQAGKYVLCEKPPGRNLQEAQRMLDAARQSSKVLKIGFNHRHHAAISRAKELLEQGKIGEPLFARCRYGHGGRPGYEREWRADLQVSGGGELLDQGVHVVDLFRWFLGDFHEVFAYLPTYSWRTPVEDNAFVLFRTAGGQVASLHASWTQWKNLFCFEVFGQEGYLVVDGLGGSYGTEQLTWGQRQPASGPPKDQHTEFPGPDVSWEAEWREFVRAVQEHRQPLASGEDGLQAMRLVSAAYESARLGQIVRLGAGGAAALQRSSASDAP